MFRWSRFFILFLLALLLIPVTAMAQDAGDEGFVLQFDRPLNVAAGEAVDGAVLINSDAVIEGRVTDTLVVISGNAKISGQVDSDVVIIGGSLELADGASVNDVTLIRSDMTRADGAVVRGDVSEQSQYVSFGFGSAIFSFVFWIGFTVVTILAGLVFVLLAGRHLDGMAGLVRSGTVESLLYGIVTLVALPLAGFFAILTLIGFPVGMLVLLVVFPLVMLMGYIVASMQVGQWLATVAKLDVGRLVSVLIGVVALQLAGVLPVFGGLIGFVATIVGTGALVRYLYRTWQGRRHEPAPAETMGDSLPA